MYRSSSRALLLLISLHADMDRGLWKNRDPRRGPLLASGINSAASRVKFTFFWYGCCNVNGVLTDSDSEHWDTERGVVEDDEHVSSDITNDL